MNIDTIRAYIQNEILNDPSRVIEPDQDLLLTGTLDSLAVVMLVGYLETETGTEIPPEDITVENFGSLNQMVEYLGTRGK